MTKDPYKRISVHGLHEMRRQGRVFFLADVRMPAEFRALHIEGALNFPLDRMSPEAVLSARQASGCSLENPIYLICQSGARAESAVENFHRAGYDNVVVVDGGTAAWEAAGFPVLRGPKTISLERQVRIGAGLLVAAGTALGAWVSPGWLILPGFVGIGLVFAGVTGFCGMALVLARMPWNGGGSCPR